VTEYVERWYRKCTRAPDLVPFSVQIKESDLFILAQKNLEDLAYKRLEKERNNLEAYLRYDPDFLHSLVPVTAPPFAPPVCQIMAEAAKKAGVGPMASVAGAINEMVGEELRQESQEVIIENGGDLLVFSQEARVVAVYAGEDSPFSFRIGIKLSPGKKWGVATSSGTVGHSLSFGKADAVVVVAESSAVADAWATSLANRVREKEDIKKVLEFSRQITDIQGILIILGKFLGVEGNIQIEKL